MPYKTPEDRRRADADPARRSARAKRERERYQDDPEYQQKIKARRAAYYQRNKEKLTLAARERRAQDPKRQWAYNISQYGITVEAWTAMLVAQSGRCAICNDPMEKPCVDHCHAGGHVRGLLCTGCNHMLGKARDRVDILRAAIEYLDADLPPLLR